MTELAEIARLKNWDTLTAWKKSQEAARILEVPAGEVIDFVLVVARSTNQILKT